ncbi:MAG: DEAD/DEAH box helicase [Chitinophagaceae bacterium]
MTFNELGLEQPILDAVLALGFETPTEIQAKAIPIFLEQQTDLIALAQTGTGKTAAFGLPLLQHIDTQLNQTQALVIAPTRELCLQITNDLKNFSKFLPQVKMVAVYGGTSISNQIKDIRRGAHIIVATPGRLIDLLDRKAVKIDAVKMVVLDEADEMLNMGFQEDMETILSFTPEEKITGLFSATMPKEIRKIANNYLKEPAEVSVGKKNTASKNITHQYAVVHAKDKLQALKRIIDFQEDFFGIVFCTTRIETQEISDALVKNGYNAECIHGDLSQQQRDKVMAKFRKHTIKILCATDVAARGIDVNDITHVIHYHLPDDIENYTHRSGRTARAGKSGISIALLHTREAYKLHQIEKLASLKFEKYIIPKGQDIIEKRIANTIDQLLNENNSLPAEFSIKAEWKERLEALSHEELVAKLLGHAFSKINIQDYQQHDDLNVNESTRGTRQSDTSDRGTRGGSRRDAGDAGVRMFINLGKKDNLRYDEMRELIYKNSSVSGHRIKDIEMKGVYSFFQTDEKSASDIDAKFQQVNYKGREVRIQRAEEQKFGRPSKRNFESKTERFSNNSKPSYSKGKKPSNKKVGSMQKFTVEDMTW